MSAAVDSMFDQRFSPPHFSTRSLRDQNLLFGFRFPEPQQVSRFSPCEKGAVNCQATSFRKRRHLDREIKRHLEREIKPTKTSENLSGLGVESSYLTGFASKRQTKQRADFLQMTARVITKRRTREERAGSLERKKTEKEQTLTRTASLDQ